jgi:hypothetical protein
MATVTEASKVPWTNPNNAKVSDDVYATSSVGPDTEGGTEKLYASNFGFAIPTGATIDGIKVEVEKKSQNNTGIRHAHDLNVFIVKADGTYGSEDKADTVTLWPTIEAYKSYGGATDKWSDSWTEANIEDSDFGVVFSAVANSDRNITLSIDHIQITVYYTEQVLPATLAVSGTAVPTITEAQAVTGGKTIILTVTDDTWVASGDPFNDIREDIRDNLISDKAEPAGWEATKADISLDNIVRTNNTVVTITMDPMPSYNITETEIITATAPASALTKGEEAIGTPTFSISPVIPPAPPQPDFPRKGFYTGYNCFMSQYVLNKRQGKNCWKTPTSVY